MSYLTQELPSGKDKAMQTELFEVDPLSDNRKLYVRAAEALAAGALVGIPTETVYGLGADALNPEAVARIFEAKGRPSFDPLIIHVHHGKEVDKYTAIPEELKELVHTLASKFWPGPLTMVLPKADIIPDIVTSGLPTVAVRVSAHPAMRGVAKALGRPVAAPSANRFGHISPTSASAVQKELDGRIEMILDAGACSEGLESTIVRPMLDEKGKPALELLREGPVTREQFRNLVKVVRRKPSARPVSEEAPAEAPGQLSSHYAPRKPMMLLEPGEEFVPVEGVRYGLLSYEGTSDLAQEGNWAEVVAMSPGSGRLAEAAVRLFALMRQMDENEGIDVIVAEAVPEAGLGRAIMDRLRRASAARE
ncbi:L-threonylcarbamoyladenylate synthase [Akkermansia sp. AKK6]